MESELPDETGAADVGILAAAGAPNANLDGFDDGIVRNQEGDAAAAAIASGGIPKAEDGLGSGSGSDDDTDEEGGEEEEAADPTATRWDIFQALQKVTVPGNFCAGGCADGSSTITPSLPTTLGLRIAAASGGNNKKIKVDVSLPITDEHTQQLRSMSWKMDDESYHNVRQIEPECITIANPAWEAALADLVRTACLRLGVLAPSKVRAELDMLLMFQRGSSIDRCCNADENENVLGTLMIQLPANFTGGSMRIWDDNDENSNDSDIVQAFDLGSGATSTAPFSCHYLCHYSDCDYEMEKIKSGTRLMLLYSLHYEGNATKPTARRRQLGMAPLERSIELLPRYDRLFAIPLTNTYGSVSLATKGLNALKVKDRGTVETIRAAATSGWKLKIAHATRTDVEDREGPYGYGSSRQTVTYSSSTTKLLRVVDETGKASVNDKNWLSKVLSLDFCEGGGKGMTLAHAPTPVSEESSDGYCSYSDGYSDYGECTDRCKVSTTQRRYTVADVWGSAKVTVKDKSDSYGYQYGSYETEERHTKSYSRTFLLVHDESSEFELKCLSGKNAIDEAAEQVCNAQDLDLLERLLLLVDNKNECYLSGECCTRLLRLISSSSWTSKLGKDRQVEYSGRIIRNLGKGVHPSEVLFDLIRNAVLRLGWSPLRESVFESMHNFTRNSLTLSDYLVKASFLLKLRSNVSEFEQFEVDPATPCLFENCLAGIAKSLQKPSYYDHAKVLSASEAVEAMVGHYGWTVLVEKVAKQCFDTMLDSYSSLALYGSLGWTIDLAQCFLKLKAITGAALLMDDYLHKLVSAYVSTLKPKPCVIDDGRFMDLMRLILQHGNSNVCTDFGLWISTDSSRLSKLLDMLSLDALDSNIDLSLEFFNKCMVWCDCIDQMLEKFPEIPQAVSSDGRIPLHHATADGCACIANIELLFEAYPKGVSSIDPVTGLYPFMLASINDNVDAAFELLLAEPSLVGGALDSEGKKRKRSPSMD